MSYYDLYGFEVDDLDNARLNIENALDIKLEARDSSFSGDYFRLRLDNGEEFVLKENYNEQEEGYVEPDYSEFPILFYIDESTNENVKCYEAKLINIQDASLIRREDL